MKGFIINADDYGMALEVNEAIEKLAGLGCISSTSIMTNMPHVDRVAEFMRKVPDVGVGVHLTLTQGRPVSPVDKVLSLVDTNGEFFPYSQFMKRILHGRISIRQCKTELKNQLSRARDLTNNKIDHWNTHQGIHRIEPLYTVFLNVCKDMKIPSMRIHKHYWIDSNALEYTLSHSRPHGGMKSKITELYYLWLRWRARKLFAIPRGILVLEDFSHIERLMKIEHGWHGIYEVVCHPATNTAGLTKTTMVEKRVEEYEALLQPQTISLLADSKKANLMKSFKAISH